MGNSNKKFTRQAQSGDDDNFVEINVYNGERNKDGLRHGRGIYLYPNGDIYEGEWWKSQKSGHGLYIYSNEQKLEGFFYKDKYIGKEPNKKLRKRMANEQRIDDDDDDDDDNNDNLSLAQAETSSGVSNSPAPRFKIKADGAEERQAARARRTARIRQKYGLDQKE